MAKLYPPHIEGALPAFAGKTLKIPFQHSRAVSLNQIKGYSCIIKDIQQSTQIKEYRVVGSDINVTNNGDGNFTLQLNEIDNVGLGVGTYYKIQLAYIGIDERTSTDFRVGYYSDVGIIKFVKNPTVAITGLDSGTQNYHQYQYQVTYSNTDPTEKLYSVQFALHEETKGNVIAASPVIIHNNSKDTDNVATETYEFLNELSSSKKYWIRVKTVSSSGYTKYTSYYPLTSNPGVPSSSLGEFTLTPSLDYDNGCIVLTLKNTARSSINGTFRLFRADEKNKFDVWHKIADLPTSVSSSSCTLWKDFTVEQGRSYKYAIAIIEEKKDKTTLCSAKKTAPVILADFEDAFLFDGSKQLRIRFDPKVSSFKTTLQEAKVDTLGNQYPIIQRNGYTKYKEFPISGLISHLMDPDGYYDASIADLKILENDTVAYSTTDNTFGFKYNTDLNSGNVALEREFKISVLDWLNNGEPKLFRSPTEGNYLVRLMNVSLSPNDVLGRMLHSFSCNAYEIDSNTPEKLVYYKIIRDSFLDGRLTFKTDSHTLGIHLTDLYPGEDIMQRSFFSNKIVKKLVFAASIKSNLYFRINGRKENIMKKENHIFNEVITECVYLQENNQGGTDFTQRDLLIIYYEDKPPAATPVSNIIDSVSTSTEIRDFYGFDTDTMSSIKKYTSQIYQIICTPRLVFQVSLNDIHGIAGLGSLGAEEFKTWSASDIKKIIQTYPYCASGILQVLNNGSVIGYIDAYVGSIIKDQSGNPYIGIPNNTMKVTSSKHITTSYTINSRQVFSESWLSGDITRIQVSEFLQTEVLYKTVNTVFSSSIGSSSVGRSDTINPEENLFGKDDFSSETQTGSNITTEQNFYNDITDTLNNSGTIKDISDNITEKLDNAAQAIGNNILNQNTVSRIIEGINASGIVPKALTNVTSEALKTISGFFHKIFGGC